MSQTVKKALDILKFLSDQSRSLGEVAQHLDAHKSTALRLLQTLEESGFVRRPTDRTFAIGFGLIGLAQRGLDLVEARTIAHPSLQALADRCGHTIHLAQLAATSVVYIDKVEGRGPVAMGSRIGNTATLHTAAVAKIILAYQPETSLDRILDTATFKQYTNTTVATRRVLREQLRVAHERGWAEDNGEYEDYINCIAFPLFDATGGVTYGMSVTALKAIADLDALRDQIPFFRQTAQEISAKLGWTGP